MKTMIKIKEVSSKYNITARTLRYYEDMDLIRSERSDNYAYRMYDETAIKRLEQILILRKLNISIKDLQRIFSSPDSNILLDVLTDKVKNIDDEAALLHELKDIILEFIREIEQMNFNNSSDIKLLYSKAKEIERNLKNVDYVGKSSNKERFIEVTQKLEKKPDVRIVELPACRMVTSGLKKGSNHKQFESMWNKLDKKRKDRFFPRDFMWWDKTNKGYVWWYAIEDYVTEADTGGFEIIDFEGGMYATVIVPDFNHDDALRAYNSTKDWVKEHNSFVFDEHPGHETLWHNTCPDIAKLLGYSQAEYFFPISTKNTH